MRRLWIGVSFLVVILTAGIVLTVAFVRIHRPLSQDLRQASQLAMEGAWEKATALTEQARADWMQYREMIAAVAVIAEVTAIVAAAADKRRLLPAYIALPPAVLSMDSTAGLCYDRGEKQRIRRDFHETENKTLVFPLAVCGRTENRQ